VLSYVDKCVQACDIAGMKRSQYAKQQGIRYRPALRWWRSGAISGFQAPTGTIIVTEGEGQPVTHPEKVAIYARVSSAEHKGHLERQAARLTEYCAARGNQVAQVVKEIASGVNDSRPKLLTLLEDTSVTRIVVEHRDRLTRFGFHLSRRGGSPFGAGVSAALLFCAILLVCSGTPGSPETTVQ
jgi:putative resolvase